ncbi:MAG: glycosyltransferase family 4 protein [Dehalococcoidales bacterium]|nr:glycosyltransferase family 4 protein [Dehalococcoidales bacterium]
MKIAHITEFYYPELGYQERSLAKECVRLGHEVSVITSDRGHPSLYTSKSGTLMGERIKKAGISDESGVQVIRLKVGFEFPNILWLSGLEKTVREFQPDLVVMHGVTNLTSLRITRLKNKDKNFKLIYDDHATSDNTTGKMRLLYPLFRWFVTGQILKAADGFAAILPVTKEFMTEKYGIPAEYISVVPLGADTGIFRADSQARIDIRKTLGYKEQDTVFIFASQIKPLRRIPVFIEAFGILKQESSNIQALMIGPGEEDFINQLKRDVEEKGLADFFTWLDAVPNDELYRYYNASDVSVWPYGASIGMREAMACKVPVIIGEKSMVTELVENSSGLLFREGHLSDLAARMRDLLNPEYRKEIGENGYRLIQEKYNWKVIAEKLLSLVE